MWQAHVQLSSCPVSAPSCTSSSDSGLALIPKCPCLSSTLCQKWPGPPARTGTADTGGVHPMSEHCGYTGGEPRRPAGASLVPAHLHLAARLTRSRVVRQEVAPQAGLSIPCLGGSAPQLALLAAARGSQTSVVLSSPTGPMPSALANQGPGGQLRLRSGVGEGRAARQVGLAGSGTAGTPGVGGTVAGKVCSSSDQKPNHAGAVTVVFFLGKQSPAGLQVHLSCTLPAELGGTHQVYRPQRCVP